MSGLRPGTRFEVEALDGEHGDAIRAWRSLGEPATLTRELTAVLDRMARATAVEPAIAGPDGVVRVDRVVSPWSPVLLRQLG